MNETLPNTTVSTDATLFREEAERARRYAAAMTDKKVIDRLNEIAALYDELAAGQDPGPTDRDKASVRVAVEISAVDAKTGKPATGFGKMHRALQWVKEAEFWKIAHEAAAEEDLATAASRSLRAKPLGAGKRQRRCGERRAEHDGAT